MVPAAETRTRDASRSREAILDAAELLFAGRGFDGVSLHEIGAAAGLSRGTPSYFFGSKDELHTAALARAFAVREESTRKSFAPVFAWVEGEADVTSLRGALTTATTEHMRFLLSRPGFVGMVARETIEGGERLRSTPRESRTQHDAFTAVRKAGRSRGIRAFDVNDAVLLFVSLTFSPISQHSTFMIALDRDLYDPTTFRRHVKLVVDVVMNLITAG